ncbi:MAG TPA: sugar transferase [Chitinophagaceae bacterium]|nr:sugar transferase [Chitinophagaceae bacterium]
MPNRPMSREAERPNLYATKVKRPERQVSLYSLSKRTLDILLSAIVILLLSPLLLPIMLGLKLTGEGYIFYSQKRIGLRNRYFRMIKFATMLKDSPNLGTGLITLRNDPRMTPMGKFLRMTKINEIPQVFNVLLGDMSMVGPRPLVDKSFKAYPRNIQYHVYNCKPGITGIGSIVFRDEEELMTMTSIPPHEFYERIIAPYKGELELWYQKHQSFWVDLKILFLTLWVVVFPKSQLMYKVFRGLPKRKIEV